MFVKSTLFKQVCQLLLSLIVEIVYSLSTKNEHDVEFRLASFRLAPKAN